MPETTLSRYYATLDAGRIDEALRLLDPDVRFVMVLPAGIRRGHGRDEMGAYLGGRGVPDRAHVVIRQSRDDDVEFLYGRVTDGGTTTGRFLSGARVGARLPDHDVRPVGHPAVAQVGTHLLATLAPAGARRQHHHEADLGVEELQGVVDPAVVQRGVVAGEARLGHETEVSSNTPRLSSRACPDRCHHLT